MRLDVDGSPEPRPLAILTELARDVRTRRPAPAAAELDVSWAVVSTRIAAQKARRIAMARLSMAGVVAVALVAAFGIHRFVRFPGAPVPQTVLAYNVEGGTVGDGGYLRESGSDAIKLHFTEGTEFVLVPGTRARMRSINNSGARIAIEHGTAAFQVVPRSEAKWQVEVGPFLVTVRGTVFTVSWDAVSERFDLKLRHGEVSVAGPISNGEISVKAGQRLVVNLPKKETVITEEEDGAAEGWSPQHGTVEESESAASERPVPAADRPAGRSSSSGSERRADTKSSAGRSWAEAVAAGRWDQVLAQADRAGMKHTLEHASSEDLLALADAARYRRRIGLARASLLAERDRFPGTGPALDAAFLLGRLEESRQGQTSQAVRWYDTYLAGAPTGTYASEALGRKMIASKDLRGSSAAEALAREYLRRFPTGPYAGAARALLLHP